MKTRSAFINVKKYLKGSAVLLLLILSANLGKAQSWMSKFQDNGTPNFFDVQKAFYDYWNAKGIDMSEMKSDTVDIDEDGEFGEYIQYKRWEWNALHRISPTGDFPDPMTAYNERNKFNSLNSEKRNRSNDPDIMSTLVANWNSIGPSAIPNKGGEGRVCALAVNPLDSNTIYVGSPSGGLWKTHNGGSTWTPTSDYISTLGISDIAIDPVDTNIIYIATGDGECFYTYSTGVMKSTDGGATWNTTGFTWQVNQGLIMNKIAINPANHNMIVVGSYNGISRSLDGGATWTNSLSGPRIYDIQFKPGNPKIVYASGYKTIYRSLDSAGTFSTVYSTWGANRIELAVTPANPNYLYALESDSATSAFHALIRSTNSGSTFTQMSNTPNILGWSPLGNGPGGQGWADLAIVASPTSANSIFIGGINVWASTDGGATWINKTNGNLIHTNSHYIHADIHRLAFLPGSSTTIISGNDGGLFRSTDTGTDWTDISAGLTIMEIYGISNAQTNSSFVTSGCQDNGNNIYNGGPWSTDIPGDGMMTIVDYTNANTIYASQYNGKLELSTNGGVNFSVITPNSGNVTGAWVTPYVIDKNSNTTLFAGYNDIWKTTNQGTTWTQITNNLTGNASYLVNTMAIAPSNSNYLYACFGPNTGNIFSPGTSVFRTANGGATWTNVTGSLPVWLAYISAITIKANDPLTVWVTFAGYNGVNKVYKTINGGGSWTNVTNNLPNVPVDCIIYDQTSNTDRIFIGTDIGVFYTDNTQGGNWVSFNTGMPDVRVNSLDMQVSGGILRAGTFGRGLWETPVNLILGTNTGFAEDDTYIKIFPNPSSNSVTVQSSSELGWIRIYNSLGELMYNSRSNLSEQQIDISQFSNGIYFLSAKGQHLRLIKK